MKKYILFFVLVVSLIFDSTHPVFAEERPGDGGGSGSYRNCYIRTSTTSGAQGSFEVASLPCLSFFFVQIITYAFAFAGTVAVVMILFAGFKYATSGGDPKQAQAARQIITFAIIGLIVVLLSVTITNVLGAFVGLDLLRGPK